jgi:transcription elongation factor GreA-like protein
VDEVVETFEPGDLVSHDKHGLGSVLGVEGQSGLLVDFGNGRVRVALPCAKLVKL